MINFLKITKFVLVIIIISFSNTDNCCYATQSIKGKIEKSKVKYLNGKQEQTILNSIPRKTKSYEFNGKEYFCHKGNYFLFQDEKYVLVNPPEGLKVKSICEGYERIIRNGQVFYFANGVFYQQVPKQKEYMIISGPIGAQILTLPKNVENVTIESEEFIVYFNSIFKFTPTRSRDVYTFVGYIED